MLLQPGDGFISAKINPADVWLLEQKNRHWKNLIALLHAPNTTWQAGYLCMTSSQLAGDFPNQDFQRPLSL